MMIMLATMVKRDEAKATTKTKDVIARLVKMLRLEFDSDKGECNDDS